MLRASNEQPAVHGRNGAANEEGTLVCKARNGDRFAFHLLVDRYQVSIYRMVYYRTRSKMDAEDLTQEIFLKAFKGLRALKSAQRFRGWLFRIALNRVRDHHRKKKLGTIFGLRSLEEDFNEPADESESRPGALQAMIRKDFWCKMEKVLEKLSKREREAFMLRYFDQLTIQEIAGILKRGQSTVKTHLYRAVAKVRKHPVAIEMMEEIRHD
jgi:RNA polymerase sigma-70 factor (ECF subfamily)